jgi:hypothetical protein
MGTVTGVVGAVALVFSSFVITLVAWPLSFVAWFLFFWFTRWKEAVARRRTKRET